MTGRYEPIGGHRSRLIDDTRTNDGRIASGGGGVVGAGRLLLRSGTYSDLPSSSASPDDGVSGRRGSLPPDYAHYRYDEQPEVTRGQPSGSSRHQHPYHPSLPSQPSTGTNGHHSALQPSLSYRNHNNNHASQKPPSVDHYQHRYNGSVVSLTPVIGGLRPSSPSSSSGGSCPSPAPPTGGGGGGEGRLEQENYYLRNQLQLLLQELHVNEQLQQQVDFRGSLKPPFAGKVNNNNNSRSSYYDDSDSSASSQLPVARHHPQSASAALQQQSVGVNHGGCPSPATSAAFHSSTSNTTHPSLSARPSLFSGSNHSAYNLGPTAAKRSSSYNPFLSNFVGGKSTNDLYNQGQSPSAHPSYRTASASYVADAPSYPPADSDLGFAGSAAQHRAPAANGGGVLPSSSECHFGAGCLSAGEAAAMQSVEQQRMLVNNHHHPRSSSVSAVATRATKGQTWVDPTGQVTFDGRPSSVQQQYFEPPPPPFTNSAWQQQQQQHPSGYLVEQAGASDQTQPPHPYYYSSQQPSTSTAVDYHGNYPTSSAVTARTTMYQNQLQQSAATSASQCQTTATAQKVNAATSPVDEHAPAPSLPTSHRRSDSGGQQQTVTWSDAPYQHRLQQQHRLHSSVELPDERQRQQQHQSGGHPSLLFQHHSYSHVTGGSGAPPPSALQQQQQQQKSTPGGVLYQQQPHNSTTTTATPPVLYRHNSSPSASDSGIIRAAIPLSTATAPSADGAATGGRPTTGYVVRNVAVLESKLEALERKYELQAWKHRELTNELTLLKRNTSLNSLMDLQEDASDTRVSTEVQTTPDAVAGGSWGPGMLPGADAVHGSPRRTTALRRTPLTGGSPNRTTGGGAYSYPSHELYAKQSAASTSSAVVDTTSTGCSMLPQQQRIDNSSFLPAPSLTAHRSKRPFMDFDELSSRQELIQWVNSRPANSRLFRALFEYLPYRDSPNEQHDSELTLSAGDFLLVHGEMDEDLFYEAELPSGRIGLVPSNYVERVEEDELYQTITAQSSSSSAATGVRHHQQQQPPPPSQPQLSRNFSDGALLPAPRRSTLDDTHGHMRKQRTLPSSVGHGRTAPTVSGGPAPPSSIAGAINTPSHSGIVPPAPLRGGGGTLRNSMQSSSPSAAVASCSVSSASAAVGNPYGLPAQFAQAPSSSALYPSSHNSNSEQLHRLHALSRLNPGATPLLNRGDLSPQFPDAVCPYPPVDVSRVTVQEVRSTDGGTVVPYPRDLLVEKQLVKSLVISWSPPENTLVQVTQYHVCVDRDVKAVVPGGYKCKALVEEIDLSMPRRVSVRAVTEKSQSPDAACTITVGKDSSVAPQEVRVGNVMPLSCQLQWYPSDSNCEHLVLLNGLKVGVCPPAVHLVTIKGLQPSTMYRASVRAKHPRAVLEERPVEAYVDFKTLPKIGLPDPPAAVQCDVGPQDGTLLVTWRPVENQPKPPSRAAVHGYLVLADGRKVTEINSPTGDHVLLRMSDFADDPPLFITVRTKTKEGAVSGDSNVVRVPRTFNPSAVGYSPKRTAAISPLRVDGSTPAGTLNAMAAPVSTTSSYHKQRQLEQSMQQQQVPSGTQGGLLMVQPPGVQSQQIAIPPNLYQPQAVSQPAAIVSQPMQAATYSLWPGSSGTGGMTYTTPTGATVLSVAGGGAIPPGAAPVPGGGGQYYVFHPQLSRTEPQPTDKPSLLEMENSYLVKHAASTAAANAAATFAPGGGQLTAANAATLAMMQRNAALGVANNPAAYYQNSLPPGKGRIGAQAAALAAAYQAQTLGRSLGGGYGVAAAAMPNRALPVIDPLTGTPFRYIITLTFVIFLLKRLF